MPTDAAQVIVGANGKVYVGAVGTTAPTDSDTNLNVGFVDLGYVTEDGVTVTDSKDVENIGAWQSFYPIRKIITGREFTVAFTLRQWTKRTITLAFGGGTITGTTELKYVPPEPEFLDERAMVIDWVDGIKNYRLYVPRGLVVENVETNVTRTSAIDLPISFAALPPTGGVAIYALFTDDPAFGTGS